MKEWPSTAGRGTGPLFFLSGLSVPDATVGFPQQEGSAMSTTGRTLFGALLLIVGGMCAGVLAAEAPAHATGPCLFQGDWNCYGAPQWNGQLMPTWEMPGGYGLPGGPPVQCNPMTYQCFPVTNGRY